MALRAPGTGWVLSLIFCMARSPEAMAWSVVGLPIPDPPRDPLDVPPEMPLPDPRPRVRADGYRFRTDTYLEAGVCRHTTRYRLERDPEGRPASFERVGPIESHLPLLISRSSEYDSAGRITAFHESHSGSSSGGGSGMRYEYDESGRITAIRRGHTGRGCTEVKVFGPPSPDGTATWESWCSALEPPPVEHRTTGTITRAGDTVVRVVEKDPDGNDRVLYAAERDPDGRLVADRGERFERTVERDGQGRITVIRVFPPSEGAETTPLDERFSYDGLGRLVRHRHASEDVTVREFAYDDEGRLARETVFFGDPDPGTIPMEVLSWRYDSKGRLARLEAMAPDGPTVFDVLAACGSGPEGTGPWKTVVTWTYDRGGRLISVRETIRAKGSPAIEMRVRLAY